MDLVTGIELGIGIFIAAVALFAAIAKVTKTKKDDAIADALEDVVDAIEKK
jgi:hypothetical protein